MKPWTFLDKLVWRIGRWVTPLIVRPLVVLGITPNQLTATSGLINFSLASFCFAQGTYRFSFLGLFFLLVHAYLDFADGDLARATGKTSKNGAWLDSRLDLVGAEAVSIGIAIGIIRSNPTLIWLVIVGIALFGRLGVLAVVFDYDRTIFKNYLEFWQEFARDKKMTFMDKIIKEFITMQSFPFLFLGTFRYFLPLMIVFNQLGWFVIISGLFNNFRWIIMFWVYTQALSGQKSHLRIINLVSHYLNTT